MTPAVFLSVMECSVSSTIQRLTDHGQPDIRRLFPDQFHEPMLTDPQRGARQPGAPGSVEWYEAQSAAAVAADDAEALRQPDPGARRAGWFSLHLSLHQAANTSRFVAGMTAAECAEYRDQLAQLHASAAMIMAAVERAHGQIPLTPYLRYIAPGDVESFAAAMARNGAAAPKQGLAP